MSVTIAPLSDKTVTHEVVERTWREEILTDFNRGPANYEVKIHRERVTLHDGIVVESDRGNVNPAVTVTLNTDPVTGDPLDGTDPANYSYTVDTEAVLSAVRIKAGELAVMPETVTTASGTVVPVSELSEIITLVNELLVQQAKGTVLAGVVNAEIARLVSIASGE